MKRTCTAFVFLLVGSQLAIADDLTLPNTFQAGTPARATEVNDNFTAVEASVDDNAASITSVSQDVATNTQSISTNSQGLDGVFQSVQSIIAPAQFVFVGFSTSQVDGSAGYYGMNAACQADFGPDSRMANSNELINAMAQPPLAAARAWVQPVIVGVAGSTSIFLADYSGYVTNSGLSCEGWSDNSRGSGLTVLPDGGIVGGSCTQIFAVACSVLQ